MNCMALGDIRVQSLTGKALKVAGRVKMAECELEEAIRDEDPVS